ncbi:MAG: YceD family protein [Pyrinomonadaceae bacterium]
MRVELASLGTKSRSFGHDYAPGELNLDEERVGLATPPTVSGQVLRNERKVVVEGHVKAVARFECDRCLRPLSLPIDADFRVEFVTPEAYQALEIAELGEEDLALSVFDGELIDVDEIVREQVLLAVPSHAICEENCKGLCPVCGADRNLNDCGCQEKEIDPRWLGLKELVNGK